MFHEQVIATSLCKENNTNCDVEGTLNGYSSYKILDMNLDNLAIDSRQPHTSSLNAMGTAKFNYLEVLQKNWQFYMANRSGRMGADNIVSWRQDSTLNDGSDVGRDLTGGYFDAGDHIKFIQTINHAITYLSWSGIDYREAFQSSGQLNELMNAVRHGTDYLLKCHEMNGGKTEKLWVQVGDEDDHNHWVPPEKITNARPSFYVDPSKPGTEAAAGAASALAAASMLFKGVDDGYSQTLLNNAITLYDFGDKYRGKYSDSVPAVNPFYTSWSGYNDELILGAVWLYRSTGDQKYLTKAVDYYKEYLGHIGLYTYIQDDHSYAALAMLAKESSDPFFKEEFKKWAQVWLEAKDVVKHTNDGFAIITHWGSAPLALSTSYLLEWYNDFVEPNAEYASFSQRQVDYVLGNNSRNYSYVIGFGENYPLRPHHRGSAGNLINDNSQTPNEHLLVGALVGGPSKDDNSHIDLRSDVYTNEVGITYNAPLVGVTIQQYNNYGGNAAANSYKTDLKYISNSPSVPIGHRETVDHN